MADNFRYSDIFSMVSPKAQDYMTSIGGGPENDTLGSNGEAVQAILDALAQGQQYDFASNFDIGTPEGMSSFMGTMAETSRKANPDQRSALLDQAKSSMLNQLTSEINPNRPLQQHAMGEMLRKSVQVGGAPLPNPDMAAQAMPQQQAAPQGAPAPPQVPPPGPLRDLWAREMEKIDLAIAAGQTDAKAAMASGWVPNWRSYIQQGVQ